MKNRTKAIAIIIATALIVALLVWWIGSPSHPPPSVATVGIGTFSQAIDYGPVYVAKHFEWFEQAIGEVGGGNVVYSEPSSFDQIHTGLRQEKLHVLFSAEAPVIKLVSDRAPIRIVEVGCTLQQEVVVRRDRKINSISDLRQKVIAVAEGTSSHYGLLSALSSVGVGPEDIKLTPGFPGEIKPIFELGGVDAWAVWPPFVEEQVIAGRGIALTGGEAKIHSVMSLHLSLIDGDARTGQALIAVIRKAKAWMRANPEESITIVAQALRMDRAIIEMSWPKHNWGAELDESVFSDIDNKAHFLKSVQVLDKSRPIPTWQDLIDLRPSRR